MKAVLGRTGRAGRRMLRSGLCWLGMMRMLRGSC